MKISKLSKRTDNYCIVGYLSGKMQDARQGKPILTHKQKNQKGKQFTKF